MRTLVFYVNDFHGMGHLTRTLRIVDYLAREQSENKFIIISNKEGMKKQLRKNVELLLLPSLHIEKRPRDCRYLERIRPELDVWINYLKKIIIARKVDLFYSDLNPSGGYGELRTLFPFLKERNVKTIIGLRDILDDIEQTKKEWFEHPNIVSIYDYDTIIVWGEEQLFKKHYSSLLKEKTIYYPGYALPPQREKLKREKTIDILALFGGGGKSKEQILYLADLLSTEQDKHIIILTGPLFSEESYTELCKKYPHITFLKESNEVPSLLESSKLVISHGGYNTLLESFAYCGNVILFPRLIFTRKEQEYRAQYLQEEGLCEYIDIRKSKEENLQKIFSTLGTAQASTAQLKNGLRKKILPLFM